MFYSEIISRQFIMNMNFSIFSGKLKVNIEHKNFSATVNLTIIIKYINNIDNQLDATITVY